MYKYVSGSSRGVRVGVTPDGWEDRVKDSSEAQVSRLAFCMMLCGVAAATRDMISLSNPDDDGSAIWHGLGFDPSAYVAYYHLSPYAIY